MPYQCPRCGQTESFYVLRTLWSTVDGDENITEEVLQELEWEEVYCPKCEYEAGYREFELRRP